MAESSRRLPALLLAGGCAAALAACGSSGAGGTQGASANSALAAAQCMRAHQVPNFPDPGADGGLSIVFSPGGGVDVNGIHFAGPAFTSAAKTCQFHAGAPPGPVTESQRRKLLAFARCMRHHGFPDWADPTFPAGGGIMGGGGPYNKNTPGLQHGATICNRIALGQ